MLLPIGCCCVTSEDVIRASVPNIALIGKLSSSGGLYHSGCVCQKVTLMVVYSFKVTGTGEGPSLACL